MSKAFLELLEFASNLMKIQSFHTTTKKQRYKRLVHNDYRSHFLSTMTSKQSFCSHCAAVILDKSFIPLFSCSVSFVNCFMNFNYSNSYTISFGSYKKQNLTILFTNGKVNVKMPIIAIHPILTPREPFHLHQWSTHYHNLINLLS